MKSFTSAQPSVDPCQQIQIDLSAMLDGELDAASVRRVMVHSDVCDSCRVFMHSIRAQAHAHEDISEAFSEDESSSVKTRALRKLLTENRDQLAKILYELGRGFVFMGISPRFSRVVAREPVPIPDMCLKGRHLLDAMQRQGAANALEWVKARDLFGTGHINTPGENLEKGKRLLREVLLLQPSYHQARIYLGHALHVEGEREGARREFEAVLAASSDPIVRAYALEHLGNVFLEEGAPERSIPCFLELVSSGALKKEPRFFTTYFNLVLSYGLIRDFAACGAWLLRLHDEFPHKHSMIRREFSSRRHFATVLAQHPNVEAEFAARFPCWFPMTAES